MHKLLLVPGIIALSLSIACAQTGGRNAFEFVNLANNARVAGLGGVNISIVDRDPGMMFQNPALLNSSMHNYLGLNYLPYFASIKGSSFSYARRYKKDTTTTWGAGLQFTNYGDMTRMDESGNDLGTFSASDYYLYAGAAHTLGYYTLGASVKFAHSRIDTYGASALLADIGGLFKHPKKDFTIGLCIKNLGMAIKKYVPGSAMNLPLDVQLGTSFKPQHMPLRISITAHHLQKLDIVYLDPTVKGPVDLQGNEVKPKKTLADKIGRHFVLGGEFILSRNFNIRFGYNYLRRRELRLQTKSGAAGFSLGFMIRIKSFEMAYSRAFYHVAGGSNYLTLTTDLNRLFTGKKKSKAEKAE